MSDASPARRPGAVQIAVVGPATCNDQIEAAARAVGEALARGGATVLTGGRGGVMAAASAGARAGGGLAVGILPGGNPRSSAPNPHLDVVLFTGLGQARNLVVVLSAAAVVAVGGGWGTLSEIALALKHRIPVVLLDSWRLERPDGLADPLVHKAISPVDAAEMALHLARL